MMSLSHCAVAFICWVKQINGNTPSIPTALIGRDFCSKSHDTLAIEYFIQEKNNAIFFNGFFRNTSISRESRKDQNILFNLR